MLNNKLVIHVHIIKILYLLKKTNYFYINNTIYTAWTFIYLLQIYRIFFRDAIAKNILINNLFSLHNEYIFYFIYNKKTS